MIVKANEFDFSDKKLSVLIYGVPSIGKTTLALSAPKPLLIDLDRGVSRVNASLIKDTLVSNNFEEIKKDLTNSNLDSYESIIIDTGGALLEMLKPYVIKKENRNSKKDGSLSLSGYGAIAREFKEFVEFIKNLKKHIIFVFHADEQHDKDDVTYRLSAEGSTKTKIWESIDLGGFMEVLGKSRNISFSTSSRFFAKGNHGIDGSYKIPELKEGVKNDFLTLMIDKYIKNLNDENIKSIETKKAYNAAMQFSEKIKAVKNLEEINVAFENLKNLNHALTSKQELFNILLNKGKELNLQFNRSENKFVKNKVEENVKN